MILGQECSHLCRKGQNCVKFVDIEQAVRISPRIICLSSKYPGQIPVLSKGIYYTVHVCEM